MNQNSAPKAVAVAVESSVSRMVNGHHSIDHRFKVPLNHEEFNGEKIEVFAREVRKKGVSKDLPMMIFFQGGPGGESPRNTLGFGWMAEILKSHRLLLLDQRGTGLSTEVLPQILDTRGDARAQAEYLANFRADSIVKESVFVRR